MKEKKLKGTVKTAIWSIVILIVAHIGAFSLDTYTVGTQADISLEQLNGDINDWEQTRTANALLTNLRTYTVPVAWLVVFGLVGRNVYTNKDVLFRDDEETEETNTEA